MASQSCAATDASRAAALLSAVAVASCSRSAIASLRCRLRAVSFSALSHATHATRKEYGYFCVGDWVDTLQIPHSSSTMGAVVRYRVADFTGEEVIHCHYLVHEDQGCLTYANITA